MIKKRTAQTKENGMNNDKVNHIVVCEHGHIIIPSEDITEKFSEFWDQDDRLHGILGNIDHWCPTSKPVTYTVVKDEDGEIEAINPIL